MYAKRAMFHGGLLTSHGALSFSCDMVLNIPFVTDLNLLKDHHQQLIDECAMRSNKHWHAYDYQPGQEVLKLVYTPDKLKPQAQGPYETIAVQTIGTLTIQLNSTTIECISIWNVKPFLQNWAEWFYSF
jgi:hypothetical protein